MVLASLLFLQLSLNQVLSEKCYAASLEGGGPYGSYEVGSLLALTEKIPASLTRYNIIGGISIGSYNTCWCSGFKVGDERNMALNLEKIWTSVTKISMVINPWSIFRFGLGPSFIDNRASYEFIVNNMQASIERNVTVGTTNANTGKLENFNQNLGIEYLPTACFASGAYGDVLPPVNFEDEWYFDGCAVANLNAFSVIDTCRDMGFDDSDIVADLFYDVTLLPPQKEKVTVTKQIVKRIEAWKSQYTKNWFISQLSETYPNIDIRYVFTPSRYPTTNPVLNIKKFVHENISIGYNDALAVLNKTTTERKEEMKRRFNYNPYF